MAQKSKDRRSVEALAALLPAGVASLSIGLAAADATASTAVSDVPNASRSVAARLEAIRGSVSEAWKQAYEKSEPYVAVDPETKLAWWGNGGWRNGGWRNLGQRRLAQLGQRLAQRRLEQLGQRRLDRRPSLAAVRQSLGQRLAQLVAPVAKADNFPSSRPEPRSAEWRDLLSTIGCLSSSEGLSARDGRDDGKCHLGHPP